MCFYSCDKNHSIPKMSRVLRHNTPRGTERFTIVWVFVTSLIQRQRIQHRAIVIAWRFENDVIVNSVGIRTIARARKEHISNHRGGVFSSQARMGLVDAGVGRPRGRGRLNRRVSDGVMIMPCEIFPKPAPRLTLPRLVLFSLFSPPILPVPLLLHPSAARRALEATRGREGSPKTHSGFSIDATAFSSGSFSRCSDEGLTLGLIGTSWSA